MYRMKIIFAFLSIIILLFSCQGTVEKPDNLIPEDKMIDILYDLALLEGIKDDYSINQQSLHPDQFIYEKYKIDSLQFVQSNGYYASDVQNYKEMYQKLNIKIDLKMKEVDSLFNGKNKPKLIKKGKPVVK